MLPTRPEINISRETELVLSVFTAKGQAGWWGRASEAPRPRAQSSSQHGSEPSMTQSTSPAWHNTLAQHGPEPSTALSTSPTQLRAQHGPEH